MTDLKLALFLMYKTITNGHKSTIVLMSFVLSLAFINLIFMVSLLNGVTSAIDQQFISNSSANIVIEPEEEPIRKKYIVDAKKLRHTIESIPGVVATAEHYNMAATFAYDKDKDGNYKYGTWAVIGVDPEEELKVTGISNHIIAGRYLENPGFGDIVLGSDIAGGYGAVQELNSLDVNTGERITLTFNNGMKRKYTVRGISKVRFLLIDQVAYVTIRDAESILGQDMPSQIIVKIEQTGDEDAYIQQIKQIAPNLKVRKWTEYASAVGDMTQSFDLISAILGMISLIVGAITIFILIYINVVNRKRQIGILRAIGIKENIIILSYILQALFYAASGICLGIIILYVLINPYFVGYPLQLPVGDVSLAVKIPQVVQGSIMLLIAALLAGFVPSRLATKENILQAIWG